MVKLNIRLDLLLYFTHKRISVMVIFIISQIKGNFCLIFAYISYVSYKYNYLGSIQGS